MARPQWKAPRDFDRSLNTRSEGLMRKAMELTNLGAQVAIVVQGRGRRIQFVTDTVFIPEWETADGTRTEHLSPDDFFHGQCPKLRAASSARRETFASNQQSQGQKSSSRASTAGHLPDSPPSTPDLRDFELEYLNTLSQPASEPWDGTLIEASPGHTSTSASSTTTDVTPATPSRRLSTSPEIVPRKRQKICSTWFDP